MISPRPTVLDASALLALMHREPGWEAVLTRVASSEICSVNWSEVVQKARARGVDAAAARDQLQRLGLRILSFTVEDAERAAELWEHTRSLGLSLGDRACLALADRRGATVVTAERAWPRLSLDIPIEVIR